MRIPLAVSLESRDGAVTRDAKVENGIVEAKGDTPVVRMRPGHVDLGLVKAGVAQLLYSWNGIKTIQDDYLNSGTIATITSGPTSTNISPSVADLQFYAQETGPGAATPRLMIHNRTQGWTVNRAGTISAITFPSAMGAGTFNVISLTRVSNTATAVMGDDYFNVGDTVTIAGANEAAYNGAQTVTAVVLGEFSPLRDIPITITRSGTTATATTTSGAHGLSSGTYTISGAAQAAYNGSFAITVTSTTQFTYTVTTTAFADITGTWNPSDKSLSVTLSGGNLVASINPGLGSFGAVRGTVSKGATQWSWECILTSGLNNVGVVYVGVATSGMSLTANPGSTTTAWVLAASTNKNTTYMYHNNSGSAVNVAFIDGDKIGLAFDGDADTLSYYKNGVFIGMQTGVSGTIYPFISLAGQGAGAAVITGDFSGLAYSYTGPPSPATGAIIITDPEVNISPSFSYAVAGSPATPATGTITAAGNGGMVPGIAYLNGYFCVMDFNDVIWSSDSDDPTTWNALNFTFAQNEAGAGRAIAKSQAYVIAFKEWSTEFFYDRQDGAVGSPLSAVDSGFTLIGCASGESVANNEGVLYWIAQTKTGGRSVYRMSGLSQEKVSTPDVDRILAADDLMSVSAYGMKLDGHTLYLLTLPTSDITLVFDATSNHWGEWSSYTVAATPSVTSITRVGDIATVTATAHGLSDGDPVLIAGANESYNGIHQLRYVDADTFEYEVFYQPQSPATGTIIFGRLTKSYFKFTKHLRTGGLDLLLHESDGHLYSLESVNQTDSGLPVDMFTRSTRLDGGTNDRKRNPSLQIIGERMTGIMMVRWSDDDCASYTAYRPLHLERKRPELRRNGAFERRTIETRYISGRYLSESPRISALELEIVP